MQSKTAQLVGGVTIAAGFAALVVAALWLYAAGAPAWVPVVVAPSVTGVLILDIGVAIWRRRRGASA